jgi:hypothetical protein
VRSPSRVGLNLGARSWGSHLGRVSWGVVAGAGTGRHWRRGAEMVVGHVARGRSRILWCVHFGGCRSACVGGCCLGAYTVRWGRSPGRCLLHLGICKPNEGLRGRRERADVDVEAATEGREREIRLCLLHIGFRVEKLLEGARRIQSMGS